MIEHLATIALPIITALVAVFNFTNSRGKIASNTANANASIQIAALSSAGSVAGTVGALGSGLGVLHTDGGTGSIQGQLLGGKNWKDPQRYENIVADVLPLLSGLFHKKAVTSPSLNPTEQAQLDALLKKSQG